ncbi:hypothetical protein AK830_g3089 [Neonectria ditissima]|uniref:ERCC4 domain-containing protein n=1 Tax=Neonectria ditissima TaxID=78410 RepID=A0A0P7BPZ3_9HYPO|nr:hypothetical protein AK830_g3089 [Neonectria ditissima]
MLSYSVVFEAIYSGAIGKPQAEGTMLAEMHVTLASDVLEPGKSSRHPITRRPPSHFGHCSAHSSSDFYFETWLGPLVNAFPGGDSKDVATSIPNPALSNDYFFLSDDFDTSIDVDEPIVASPARNKRKVSPLPGSNRPPKRPSPLPVLGPTVRTSAARALVASDPIDLTSSPERAKTPKPKPWDFSNIDTHVSARHPTQLSQDSDPFNSPPPRPENPITTVPESSDPFASSPRPTDATSKPRDTRPTEKRPIHAGETTAPVAKPTSRKSNWDPISSSAPQACSFDSSPPRPRPTVIDIEDSGPDISDDEFPDIADFDIAKCRRSQLQRSQSEVITSKSRKTSKPQKSVEERTREKEARAAAKEVDKENKRREKQQAKEAKVRDKERTAAMAEVNKLRTDKKVSTPEMIVDMPSSLNPTTVLQLETMLQGLNVHYTTWNSPVENAVKWRRKVRSRYNDDLGLWEPLPLQIHDEKHILVIVTAAEFVKLALEDDLESHVGKMTQHFDNHQIIYLLEGLMPWMRKNRNLRNRQFASHVRSQEPPAQTTSRRKINAEDYVSEEKIEDALLQLQVMHNVLIHHTAIPLETAQWITIFTQHVSTVPYRRQRDQATLGAGFCMESGQVKTGDDAKDTYVRMLQEIVRVTAPIAYGIAAEFETVSDLVRMLETDGPARLEGIRKSANKDGAFSDRTVGQAVSRRMHKVFTGRDDGSTDV